MATKKKDKAMQTVTKPVSSFKAPEVESVAYRGAVPVKSFVGWVLMVLASALVVGGMASQLLVSQRMDQLVDETAARVELQGQGRANVVGEWAKGLTKVADGVANADIVRIFVNENGGGVAVSETADNGLAQAMAAQRPYMQEMLREFVAKNKFDAAYVVKTNGGILLSEGRVAASVLANQDALKQVVQGGAGMFRPLRVAENGAVVLDVLRPIKAPGVDDASSPVVGVLWVTLPVGERLAELVAASPLDRKGERTAMVMNDGGRAVVIGRTALAPLPENYMDLENRLAAGRVVQESVVDMTPVFATLKPVEATPYALLQEYVARDALAIMNLYKPGLFAIVALLVVVLAALMLALTLHLMAQRNRTRVKLLGQTMEALVRVVEARDPHLAGHHSRVARLAVQVANQLRMGVGERATLYYAGLMASVGRLLVPRTVLAKKAALSSAERKQLEVHVAQAMDILGALEFDLPIVSVIGQMYEREDGSGYPHGLKSAEISRMAKVLAACDAYVAMTSERAHRSALSKEQALKALTGGAFAKDVVGAIKNFG